MKYNGVSIKGFRIINESNGREEIATICEGHIETSNGYKVEVLPMIQECKE